MNSVFGSEMVASRNNNDLSAGGWLFGENRCPWISDLTPLSRIVKAAALSRTMLASGGVDGREQTAQRSSGRKATMARE
jgi:hypothetical protein